MRKFKLFSMAACSVLLSGCATLMSGGSTQQVNVQAIDAKTNRLISDAVCSVKDGSGNVYPVYGNPGAVTVTKGKGALTVSCRHRGFVQTKVGAGDSFNAWMLGNIIFWPGAIVDAVSGAATKYPSHLTVLMERR